MTSSLEESANHPLVSIDDMSKKELLAMALVRQSLGLPLYPDQEALLNESSSARSE